MPKCKGCGQVFGVFDLNAEGYCNICKTEESKQEREKQQQEDEYQGIFDQEKEERRKKLDRQNSQSSISDSIMITTETSIDIPIEERIEVIFVEYVYGLHIVKDFFSSIRDIVGGRVESIEKPIQDTNQKIIKEMKEKAYILGGDAVIGLKIDYSTYTGIISIVAVGTVVKLKKT